MSPYYRYRYRYRYYYRRNLPVRSRHAHTAATAPLLQLLKQLYSGSQPASSTPPAALDQPASSIIYLHMEFSQSESSISWPYNVIMPAALANITHVANIRQAAFIM